MEGPGDVSHLILGNGGSDVRVDYVIEFQEGEISVLTFWIIASNGSNRLAGGLSTPAGDHVSPFHATVRATT